MSERISPDDRALSIRRYKIVIATALADLQSWQPHYGNWEPVGIPVCRMTMKTLRDLDTGLKPLLTFLKENGWPSPPSPLPAMRPVWNLLGNACECSDETAIAVRSYLPMSNSLEELALRKLRSARDQLEALERKVHHLLDTLERFYPGSLGVELPEPAAACKTPGDAAAIEDQTFALAQMEMLNATLEQAMVPIDEKIALLQKNWAPRDYKFWQQVMTCVMDTHLVLAQATIPPVGGYRESLDEIGDCTDEAGILLTVLLMTHDPTASALEERIRQRQRVMKALEKLSETVHQARVTGQERITQLLFKEDEGTTL